MQLTLRHKVNGAIILTFILIAILFSAIQWAFQQHRQRSTIEGVQILLETLVERDTEQLANEIFDSRLKAIKIRTKEMKSVKGILSISVFDQNGNFLVSDGTLPETWVIEPKEMHRLSSHSTIQEKIWQQETALLFAKEIRFLDEKLGYIQIYYTLENIENDERISQLITGGMLFTILIIMLVMLNLMLSKALLTPILYLRDATKHIVDGRLESNLQMTRTDELGSLADSFAQMQAAIKEKISDLKRTTSIIEFTSDLVLIITPERNIIYANGAARGIIAPPTNLSDTNTTLSDIYPAWAYKKVDSLGIPRATENGTWEGETAILNAKGEELPVSQVIISHLNSNGQIEYYSTIIRDISQSKKSEAELRYLRNYLANIIDSMPSLLIGVDKEGRVTQWNKEASRTTGLSASQVLNRPLLDVFPRFSSMTDRLQVAMDSKQMVYDSKRAHLVEGATRYEDITIYPLVSDGLEGAVIRIDDVTDKVKMEEMMLQSEKMLSVGGLAAGMAHEINNPLAGMMQTATVLARRLTDTKMKANLQVAEALELSMSDIQSYAEARQVPKLLENIRLSGVRASEIVTNMLSFSRKSDDISSKHNIAYLLDQTVILAGSDYSLKRDFDFRKISIFKEYEQALPDIPCDSGQIQQVFLNILRNGAEAMQELQERQKDEVDGREPHFFFRISQEPDKMVRIEIEDNGPGMDEDTRKRVLEPFFTTKPIGQGTGLGLSVSYFIVVENHGGTIHVETSQGHGTKFVIRLPLERKRP